MPDNTNFITTLNDMPVHRRRIVRAFADEGMGYLIQQTPEGEYRYIAVEAGEDDILGDTFPTVKDAIHDALADWRVGGEGDSYAPWCRAMAAAADAEDDEPKAEAPTKPNSIQDLDAAINAAHTAGSMELKIAVAETHLRQAREAIANAISLGASRGFDLTAVIEFNEMLSRTQDGARDLHTEAIQNTNDLREELKEMFVAINNSSAS